MRVLIAAYYRASSGIATYTVELASLLRARHEVVVISMGDYPGEADSVREIPVGRVPRYLPLLRCLTDSSLIRRIVDEVKPDVVHETLPPSAFMIPRRVTTSWGYVSAARLAWLRTSLTRFPENLGGVPVTIQHLIANHLSQRRAAAVIHLFGRIGYTIAPPIQLQPRKAYGEALPLRILFVSRDLALPRKNLKLILLALPRVHRPVELHVVGRGVARGGFVNHGWLDRNALLRLMREMDAIVIPSLYEELGYVGLEACSVGLPVMASNIPPFRSLLPNSLFFSPNNPSELAALLESLNADTLRKLGTNSHALIERTRSQILSDLEKLYQTAR